MLIETNKLSLLVDLEKGRIASLIIDGIERLVAPTPLFRVRLRDREGKAVIVSSCDETAYREIENGAIYTGFNEGLSVCVGLKRDGEEIVWSIKAELQNDDLFAEWVEFPSVTLPALEENNTLGNGGRVLFPYNEGVLISDIERKESSWLMRNEPEYPSMGCYTMFPNMVSSQMLAYIWKDAALYIGAHDKQRGLKDINFIKEGDGVKLRFRLYCGKDFGESFSTDYPIIFSVTDGKWEAAAERYRAWFESELPRGVKKISENTDLPEWYIESPLVVTYPIRGVHDMDEMKPNRLYPYTNALPYLKEIKEKCDSRLLVLLMHWEGTAPWAPPYVWPPFGDKENFDLFLSELHKTRDMLGVYCSGFGYTAQSNLIRSYAKAKEYEEKELWRGMCADIDGEAKLSKICTDQRSGYDICPASEIGRKLLDDAYGVLLGQDLDYVQILDQNHGGGQYFCYSREHGHAPAPGPWMTESMQDMLTAWNKTAGKTLFGCESAAAEPFIGNLLYSDNRFELNYHLGIPVPLYAYIYHEYVRNFMGNQVCCPFDTAEDTLRYRLGYSFCAGDSMTLVMTQDGEFASHWGMRDFSYMPDKEKAMTLIRNLTAIYRGGANKYLCGGRMIAAPRVECENISMPAKEAGRTVAVPAILSSAWEGEDRSRVLLLVNPQDKDVVCKAKEREITVPALSGVIVDI